MKLRVKSHSVRFRITSEEFTELTQHGRVTCDTHVPDSSGAVVVFRHEVVRDPTRSTSDLLVSPFSFSLVLNDVDFQMLSLESDNGAYIRREWTNEQGTAIRFVAYIETDKKKKRKHEKRDNLEKHNGAREGNGIAESIPREAGDL